MWDCKHHTQEDQCRKRNNVCFPGGFGCVLEDRIELAFFDKTQDPLRKQKKTKGTKASSYP